jgi:hypothetical protein
MSYYRQLGTEYLLVVKSLLTKLLPEEVCLLGYNAIYSVVEHVTSIFRVEEYAKQETSTKQVIAS